MKRRTFLCTSLTAAGLVGLGSLGALPLGRAVARQVTSAAPQFTFAAIGFVPRGIAANAPWDALFIVENTHPAHGAESVVVTAMALDEGGAMLGSAETESIPVLRAGERRGFVVPFPRPFEGFPVDMTVRVTTLLRWAPQDEVPALEATPAALAQREEPVPLGATTPNQARRVEVTAAVSSPFADALGNVRVTAIAFDAAGAIVGGGEGRLGALAANATVEQHLAFVAERPVASVELFAVDPTYVRYRPCPHLIG